MEWYYVKDGDRVGPVAETEFAALTAKGEVGAATYVWHERLPDWVTYGHLTARAEDGTAQTAAPPAEQRLYTCSECGEAFEGNQVLAFGPSFTCAACKPVFFQRIRQGTPVLAATEYGGFWIRFGAYAIDYAIFGSLSNVLNAMLYRFSELWPNPSSSDPPLAYFFALMSVSLLSFSLMIVYYTWFVGRYGATPGKMICSLRIVRSGGEPVTYMRAFARFWATFVSGMFFYIGYIMAAFDEEKRALHDYMCDTRVVRVRRL